MVATAPAPLHAKIWRGQSFAIILNRLYEEQAPETGD